MEETGLSEFTQFQSVVVSGRELDLVSLLGSWSWRRMVSPLEGVTSAIAVGEEAVEITGGCSVIDIRSVQGNRLGSVAGILRHVH
jgi:hypothetical protein